MSKHSTMNQADAREYGWSVGYGIGEDNAFDYTNYDQYLADCLETEQDHFRQFSPFEFYASEFNKETRETAFYRVDRQGRKSHYTRITKQDPDRMWDFYNAGVAKGLREAWGDFK